MSVCPSAHIERLPLEGFALKKFYIGHFYENPSRNSTFAASWTQIFNTLHED
jgi:hypothetical protein